MHSLTKLPLMSEGNQRSRFSLGLLENSPMTHSDYLLWRIVALHARKSINNASQRNKSLGMISQFSSTALKPVDE
jgi:hypothetical protein